MNNKERGEQIRRQIVRDVRDHPSDISKHISTLFAITPQAVNAHIKKKKKEGWLTSTGSGKGKRYFLGDSREYQSLFPLTETFTEDGVWRDHFAYVFDGLPENILDICHYGFTEMVNNVIDHSSGKQIYISATRDQEKIMIYIMDDGEGIFRKIKRLCQLNDERQALLELSKGKLTTDPNNHTGEGIFFTSRVFDQFEIESRGIRFSHDDSFEFDYIQETNITSGEVGTAVHMLIERDSERDIQSVFDDFAGPDAYQFNKTVIPVRLAQYGDEKLV
ncbi:MAG: ATP-binding protein, partial [Candidatus Thiodiazotropha sp.]